MLLDPLIHRCHDAPKLMRRRVMTPRILLAIIAGQAVLLAFGFGLLAPRPGAAAAEPAAAARQSLADLASRPHQVSAANVQDQPIAPAVLGVSLAEARVIIDATTAYARSVNG